MKRRLTHFMVVVLVLFSALSITACDDMSGVRQYPLISVDDQGSERSYVYRASGQSVEDVANHLANSREPEQMSEQSNDQMFLVYPDEVYHIQRDTAHPSDTIIEVDNQQFVRDHYDHSFLTGFIAASLLDHIFSGPRYNYGSSGAGYGHYHGYSYTSNQNNSVHYHAPTTSEQKAAPPLTSKSSSGTFTKRGTTSGSGYSSGRSSSGSSRGSTSGSSGSLFGGSSRSGGNNYSPPKTSWGSHGSLSRRSRSSRRH